jgi:membrane-associated phospholipid phosphatase
VYVALLSLVRPLAAHQRLALCVIPIMLCGLWFFEAGRSRGWSQIVRQWASLGLILAAYWSLGWFTGPHHSDWQTTWLAWDRALLDAAGLRDAIELAGPTFPIILETCYLFLYAIPPVTLGILYVVGERRQAQRFLLVLFLGTFTAYALLPFFPVSSPRVAFPGSDLPHVRNPLHTLNASMLDSLDISTSVFPSGHVAVAFSSALGLLSVLPRRRRLWLGSLAVASLVYIATIYGRYHYAVDGLASILIALAAWRLVERRFGVRRYVVISSPIPSSCEAAETPGQVL